MGARIVIMTNHARTDYYYYYYEKNWFDRMLYRPETSLTGFSVDHKRISTVQYQLLLYTVVDLYLARLCCSFLLH